MRYSRVLLRIAPRRFTALKQAAATQEAERTAMRKALRAAQASAQKLATQNERLTAVLTEVHREQNRMAEAKCAGAARARALTVAHAADRCRWTCPGCAGRR